MPNTPTPSPNESTSPEERSQNVAPAPERKEKLNSVIWVLLFTGTAMLDLFQAGLSVATAGTLGTIANILIDLLVGPSLALFFYYHDMLDWKLGLSLIIGFAADFFTAGIAPAWLLDMLYAWMITDGASKAALAPVIGEAAQKAALAIMSKGKSPTQQSALGQRSAGLQSQNANYLAKQQGGKSVDGIKPGTGGGAERTKAGPSEKPPVLSGQNSSPASPTQNKAPAQTPQTAQQNSSTQSPSSPSEHLSGGSDGPQSTPDEKKGDDKKPEEEKKKGEGKKKEGGESGDKNSENPENGGEKKEGEEGEKGEGDDKSKEDKEKKKKEGENKNHQEKSGGAYSGGSSSRGQNHNQSSGGQSSSGASGGNQGNSGEQPQNPPRYGVDEDYAREHPFISGVDTALGVKGKEK